MTNELPFNLFDGAVYLCLAVAVIAGLRSGLMRGLATIVGYLIAAPVAVAVTPYLAPLVNARLQLTPSQLPLLFFAVFFIIGFLLAALMRGAVGEITGHRIGVVDRAAGGFLGAFRVVLTPKQRVVAVLDIHESMLGPLHLAFEVDRSGFLPPHIPREALERPSTVTAGIFDDIGHAVSHAADSTFHAVTHAASTVASPVVHLAKDAAADGFHALILDQDDGIVQRRTAPAIDQASARERRDFGVGGDETENREQQADDDPGT